MNYTVMNRVIVSCLFLVSLTACGGGNDTSVVSSTPQVTAPAPVPPSVPPGVPAVGAPPNGSSYPSSPVRVSFALANFTIGAPGTQHLRFSIDGGPLNDFFVGTGDDLNIGVQLAGVHTHFAHWTSPNSFDLFSLDVGSHSVGFVLVDGSNVPLPNAEAQTIYTFTVQQPPAGNLSLQSVLSGLNFPVGLVQASDGRIFYNERLTGRVRVINSNWQLDPTEFCSVTVQTSSEQGLLGLALDPNFTSNQTLYVYYTAQGSTNRVSRLVKPSNGPCAETQILPNLPTSGNHNGGIITFGPDGKLYIVIGDAEVPSNAQDPNSLAGKILRVNTDGSAAPGNPFSSGANAQKVYSLGHRNSFGLTFHPSTGQLWESENGPNDNDEVNGIVAGGNYGWPVVGGMANNPSYRNPIVAFNPVIAPTGIVGIPSGSSIYPATYQNNLLVAEFISGTIRLVTTGGTTSVAYPGGVGGLLSLMRASDGYVYASNANGIFRVTVSPTHH